MAPVRLKDDHKKAAGSCEMKVTIHDLSDYSNNSNIWNDVPGSFLADRADGKENGINENRYSVWCR
jgi:hypothetical protein